MERLNWKSAEIGGKWYVGYVSNDGTFNYTDGDVPFDSKEKADAEVLRIEENERQLREDQMNYNIGLDYACGIRD